MVLVNNESRHIVSYMADFLFQPQRLAHTQLKHLSGGEQNRILLAKLFTQPANLMIMDEPTNDLDIESIEVLDELMNQYPGTIIFVTHDRRFISNVATHNLIYSKDKQWETFFEITPEILQQYFKSQDEQQIQSEKSKLIQKKPFK